MTAAERAREHVRSRGAESQSPESEQFAAELAAALADVERALGAQNQAEREPLFFPAADLFKRDYPPTSWLVAGLATRGGMVMIGGEPKTLKTWLALAIALAVSSGTKACGEFQAERGAVAYFFAEDLDRHVRNRLRAELAGLGLDPSALANLYLRPRGKFLDVMRDQDLAWLIASCRRLGKLDVLVLDPLRDISSAAEDKSDEMSRVLRRLRLLGELLGRCTVVVVHHTAKNNDTSAKRRPGQRLRGSSAIHGSVDSGIYLSNLDGDGSNTFCNVVDSEIKGARSAGRFELLLAIEDDANGEAVRASWTVSRAASDSKPKGVKKAAAEAVKAKQDVADDEKVVAFVRKLAMRGERLTRRKLRNHGEAPLSDRRMRNALDRLIELGRFVLDGPSVVIPEPEQHHAS